KPSLTVREGPQGLAALGTPANWSNEGVIEGLLPAFPFGDTLYFWCGTLFPSRVRLTFGVPGQPENTLQALLLSEHPSWVGGRSRFRPNGHALLEAQRAAGVGVGLVVYVGSACKETLSL